MPILLAPLPYSVDALEPAISAKALSIHHGRHYGGYVERLNAAIAGTGLEHAPLEEIVLRSARGRVTPRRLAVFNNAAQAFNHQFFFASLRPHGARRPSGELAARLARDLGGVEAFVEAFKAAATAHFGSGWAWLVLARGALRIVTTSNADSPITRGQTPLLALDVWEHAYYLDHHERRAAYVNGVVDHLLDWDFAERSLQDGEARQRSAPFVLEVSHA